MSCTCHDPAPSRNKTLLARSRVATQWILPGVALAFVPKCPGCVAAYVALWTGLGISITTATYLRWILIATCLAALAVLASSRLRHLRNLSPVNFQSSELE
ncbi:hypothetical protein N9N28_06230 [Rubripirellula amarantea]|nr:hypothetical protein [Rubripirellula amarantea]